MVHRIEQDVREAPDLERNEVRPRRTSGEGTPECETERPWYDERSDPREDRDPDDRMRDSAVAQERESMRKREEGNVSIGKSTRDGGRYDVLQPVWPPDPES